MKSNPFQQKAIEYEGRHLLIIAGPGTGKTHTLTLRIARISKKLKENQHILAVTFTNKAALEMKERIDKLCLENYEKIQICTFHSFCLDFLQSNFENFTLIPENEIKEYAKRFFIDKTEKQINEVLSNISFHKATRPYEKLPDELLRFNNFLSSNSFLDYDDLIIKTAEILKTDNDLLLSIHKKYPYIFIDEYQDVNSAQHELLKILCSKESFITAIGDPHQAIYGFRGSSHEFFNNFINDFKETKTINLSENFRNTLNIIEASSQIIEKYNINNSLKLTSKISEKGRLIIHQASTDKAEAEYVVKTIEKLVGGTSMFSHDSGRASYHSNASRSFSDFAVFYRFNFQNILLKQAFQRSGIPFQISGEQSLCEQPGILEVSTIFKLITGQKISTAGFLKFLELAKQINIKKDFSYIKIIKEKTKIDLNSIDEFCAENNIEIQNIYRNLIELKNAVLKKRPAEIIEKILTFEYFKDLNKKHDFKEAVENLRQRASSFLNIADFLNNLMLERSVDLGLKGVEKVSLMTLHSSKGLEFPIVFIAGCEQGLIPSEKNENNEIDDERRLFYVGITRAKEELYLVSSARRYCFGKGYKNKTSVFIKDIKEDLKKYEKEKILKAKKKKSVQYNLFKI